MQRTTRREQSLLCDRSAMRSLNELPRTQERRPMRMFKAMSSFINLEKCCSRHAVYIRYHLTFSDQRTSSLPIASPTRKDQCYSHYAWTVPEFSHSKVSSVMRIINNSLFRLLATDIPLFRGPGLILSTHINSLLTTASLLSLHCTLALRTEKMGVIRSFVVSHIITHRAKQLGSIDCPYCRSLRPFSSRCGSVVDGHS